MAFCGLYKHFTSLYGQIFRIDKPLGIFAILREIII